MMKMNLGTGALLITAGAAMLPVAAWAQQPAATADTSEGAQTRLDEIVVTAQRREERLQDVPISVTALGAKQLTNSGITTTQDIATVAPALNIGQSFGQFLPRLRGIGTTFGGPGIENSIATYIDGVYIGAASASLFSLAGVERIEILKGPQGTLFGRNATGGLVQVVTKKPSETFSGMLSGSYGNYDTAGADAYVTGGIAPQLAMDFAAHMSFQGDGYGRNRFLNKDANRTDSDVALRSQLLFDGENTSARLAADYSRMDGSAFEIRRSPFDISTLGPILQNQSPWDGNGNVPYESVSKSYGLSLKVDHQFDFADLVSITAARGSRLSVQLDADTTPTDGLAVIFRQKEKQFSQELQLVSKPHAPVSWLIGAYAFSATSSYDPNDVHFGPILQDPLFPMETFRTVATQRTRSYAAFGQATVPLGESTQLTVGLRYTTERKRIRMKQDAILAGGAVVALGQRGPDSVSYKRPTWRVSLDHHFTPDVMAYASANRGFKSGGFNAAGGIADPAVRPEVLDAYELGVKADLFDHRVRFNPSFFYYDYRNVQVTTYTPQSQAIFLNGPSAEVYGLDLDFTVRATSQLTLRGGLTVIHDRFGDFPNAPFNYSNFPVPGGVLVIANAKDNRIPFTADWSSSIAADYQIPTNFGSVTLSTTYNHSDGFFLELDNLRRQSPFDLVSASIRIEDKRRHLFASLWSRNLLNEAVLVNAIGVPAFGGAAQYQAPRTYGVTIGASF
jgi:iron complex outermembrane recepter protein